MKNKKPEVPNDVDPFFRSKNRPCGRCQKPFDTTPRNRYFCDQCWVTVRNKGEGAFDYAHIHRRASIEPED